MGRHILHINYSGYIYSPLLPENALKNIYLSVITFCLYLSHDEYFFNVYDAIESVKQKRQVSYYILDIFTSTYQHTKFSSKLI